MPVVFRRTWSSQPQGVVGIDWGNTVTVGLASAAIGGGIVAGSWPAPVIGSGGTNAKAITRIGVGYGDGATSPRLSLGKVIPITGPLTYLAVARCDTASNGANDVLIGFGDRATLRRGSGGSTYEFFAYTGSTWHTATSGSMGARQGKIDCVIGRHVPGTQNLVNAFGLDDAVSVSGSVSTSTRSSASQHDVGIGADFESGRYLNGTVFLGVVWNRTLSDSETNALLRNPWQIFAPQPRLWAVPAGAATDTLWAQSLL